MTTDTKQLLEQIEAVVGASGLLSGSRLAGRSAGVWSGKAISRRWRW